MLYSPNTLLYIHAPEGIIKFLIKIASRNANETQMQIEDEEGQLIIALNRNCELVIYMTKCPYRKL